MTSRAPNATPVRKALWWAEDYLYAGWRQLRSAFSRRRAVAFASGHRSPILVVPGVYEPWRFMLPLIRELHELGHPVHVIEPLRNNRIPVPSGARLVHDPEALREVFTQLDEYFTGERVRFTVPLDLSGYEGFIRAAFEAFRETGKF